MKGYGPGQPPVRMADDLLMWLLLGLAAAALAVGGFVWAVGETAGHLFGSGSPATGLLDAPGVLPRLLDHLGDPSAAWPQPARGRLPGPTGMYAAFALVVLALASAGTGAAALWRLVRTGAANRRERLRAAWAHPGDLRSLFVGGRTEGRLTLGQIGRRLVAAEPRQSVLVVAPTQAGKTSGLVVPAVLEWDGPVLATSVKRDLLDDTIARRRSMGGEVWVFDPSGVVADGGDRAAWTPLVGCSDWAGARRTAASLCAAARRDGSGLQESAFWFDQAAQLLAPALFAARSSGASMGDVVSWLSRRDELEVAERLAHTDCPAAEDAWEATVFLEERAKSSVYMTARTVLGAYADPEVAFWADQDGAIDIDRLLDGGPHTLYLCAPLHEQERLAPLFVALIRSVVHRAYERAGAGRLIDRPLLLALDEAANVAPLPDLPQIASTGAGVGLQLMSVFQDLSQMEERYGRSARTLVNNHRAKLLLAGISCERTLEYAQRLLGEEEVEQRSYTLQAGGGRSEQRSTRARSLGRVEVLRQLPPGGAVLIYGHLPPIRMSLRPWFLDEGLRQLAAGREAGPAPRSEA